MLQCFKWLMKAEEDFLLKFTWKMNLILTISNGILSFWGIQWDPLRQNNCIRLFLSLIYIFCNFRTTRNILQRGKATESDNFTKQSRVSLFSIKWKCCMQCSLQRLLVCFLIQFLKSFFSKTRENSKLWMPTAWNYAHCVSTASTSNIYWCYL